MKNSPFHLYVIIDTAFLHKRPIALLVTAVLRGGASMLQLRAKNEPIQKVLAAAKTIQKISNRFNAPFILNDRVDLVLAVGASGVHLGQDDVPISVARKLLGKDKIIGISVKTVEEAQRVQKDGADYLGVGPIFTTKSKNDAGNPIGLKRLSHIAQCVSIPVVGIGGITVNNADTVMKAGASGIAVISAVMGAKNPMVATMELRKIVDSHFSL